MDAFKNLWAEVDAERREMVKAGIEKMIADPEGRGLLITQNQFGVILSADLSDTISAGMIYMNTQPIDLTGLYPVTEKVGSDDSTKSDQL